MLELEVLVLVVLPEASLVVVVLVVLQTPFSQVVFDSVLELVPSGFLVSFELVSPVAA
ncbi:hypothetical protein P608_09940 [Comamonas thiooxydans]|uniref:Uncharacterized protein n=1 Tax=Comamonas thiooxydans TaxID=363952 RepID=A0A0E3CGY2_9BURK|nr:hypothetical protein P608_09940 [Comamonas thiooxydans]KGH24053.1 hypothetical protein P606_10155 [Comamonas thiooxydans]KGH25681.1 hypothetical protein P607_05530 [Comamonas thiooxydans]